MYVTKIGFSYYAGSEQRHSRAPFLILASSSEKDANGFETLYGALRSVALSQFGHFMMGAARIAGERIGVSGSFGSDSLPLDFDKLSPAVKSKFWRIDPDLSAAYWRDPNGAWEKGDYVPIERIGQNIAGFIRREERIKRAHCSHHAKRIAKYTNERRSAEIHKDAIWYYCDACADEYLTERGREEYRI